MLVLDHMKCNLIIDGNKHRIFYNNEPIRAASAVIPRIGASVTNYGSSVIRHFEVNHIFTAVRSEALIRARNKFSCMQTLASKGIRVPITLIYGENGVNQQLLDQLGDPPHILKLLQSTHGQGVLKIDSEDMFQSVNDLLVRLQQEALIQEFIEEAAGTDIRAFVVDGEVVAAMKRQAQEGEFRSNLHLGGRGENVQLSSEEHRLAIRAADILDLDIAGVDMLRSNKGPLVLEVNASPGLEGIERVTGVDIGLKIIEFVERKLKRKGAF